MYTTKAFQNHIERSIGFPRSRGNEPDVWDFRGRFGDAGEAARSVQTRCTFLFFFPQCENVARGLPPNGKPRETRGVFSSGPPGEEDLIFIKNREACAPSSRDCTRSGSSSEADHTHARTFEKDSLACFAPPRRLNFEA